MGLLQLIGLSALFGVLICLLFVAGFIALEYVIIFVWDKLLNKQ